MKQLCLTIIVSLLSQCLPAQEAGITSDSLVLSIKPYGSFRGHFAFYNKEIEFQENASRIGFEIGISKKNLRFFVGSELQMNMFRGESSFNANANLSGGFLVAEPVLKRQVFSTRLGYLGVDLRKFGILSFGKQWSVYYDVTGYTDKFNVFSGQGSATFVAGTDGGEIGTGRADQALVYRNHFGPVFIGAQMQAKTTSNNQFVDGYGFSVQVEAIKPLRIGAAFNSGFINKNIVNSNSVLGLNAQPKYVAVGADYKGKSLELAAVYVHQTNGDLVQGHINDSTQGSFNPTVVFDANGFELYGKYILGKIAIVAGCNFYDPKTKDIRTPAGETPVDAGFKKNYLILGLEYRPIQMAYLYAEQRISGGKTALGDEDFDVFTIGVRIDVEKIWSRRFN